MKRKFICKIIAVCMILTLLPLSTAEFKSLEAQAATEEDRITFVFSHDMHSHLEKFGKIRTLIEKAKEDNEETFVLDGGDFSMGTPYQTIFKEEAAELRMMGAAGYDVTTLGNHEFDYRSEGLAQMLETAAASGDRLPQIVISNIDWEKTLAEDSLKEDGENLRKALDSCGAAEYTVLERGTARIGVFGIFGKESDSYAPESGTYFKDQIETAQKTVEQIRSSEQVDMVVCLSHSGTSDDPKDSEDEILAREVDGIDLIISGHSHTELAEPIRCGDTIIASAGQYNQNLGVVTFREKDGKMSMEDYRLIPLDEAVEEDTRVQEQVLSFKELVNEEYFSRFGYRWDRVLTENPVNFTDINDFAMEQGEDVLGSLIADSYRYGVRQAEGEHYRPVDVTVAPAGVIRNSLALGKLTAADAFNVLSLGTGKDGIAGYPLVSVYLTGKELKLVAEIDASVSEFMQPARLYFSGLNYTYNPHRLIFNRAYHITGSDEEGNSYELEDQKLYRVVADLYSAQMLGTVNSMSYGLLAVSPKDQNGTEITDYEEHIIYLDDGSELKEWYALAGYLDEMGSDEIAQKYGQLQGRKILDDSRGLVSFFKSPNRLFFIFSGVLIFIVVLLVLLTVAVYRLIRRRVRRKN